MGDEGEPLGSWGSVLKLVSGHHVLLYSEDGRKMKMKVVSQQKVIEYSGYCSRFYRLFFPSVQNLMALL